MRRLPWNLPFHELIGLKVRVLVHPDPTVSGVEGVVVDETAKTFVLEVEGGRRIRVLKEGALFEFTLPGGKRVVLKGESVLGSPAERVKRLEKGRGVARLVAGAKRRYTWA